MQKNYLKELELKSILKVKEKIEKIITIKNKYLLVKSLNEISVYNINNNKLKFKIQLNKEIKKEYYYDLFHSFIFDFNYKLRIINYEKNINFYKLLTDEHLIEVNFDKNKWRIINRLQEGIYLFNLDVLINDTIFDQKGIIKKKLGYSPVYGLYEIKEKYLIINSTNEFLIFDINDNYKKLYSKENSIYDFCYKHPSFLNEQIIFSAILNPYVSDGYDFIFLNFDFDKISERSVECYYNDADYENCDKLFIIHKFEDKIYLQLQKRGYDKIWSIVKEDENIFSCIQSLDDKKLFGDNLHFLPNNLIISWDFKESIIKFIKYN